MSGSRRPFVLATAGHVDHGKSSLVRALTGTDPDRLPEERRRGMTIDLGFASLAVSSPPGAEPPMTYDVGVVDVPGHEDFVKNMVAGVAFADAALLVVAADDGWMPQTEEHLQILDYLGIRRGVVALSRADLCGDIESARASVRARLAGSFFDDAEIVPTSTRDGRGLDALRDAIARTLAAAPPPQDRGKPRLAVDRAFAPRGVGTVVTGTLVGGPLRRGDAVVVQPGDVASRIRGLQSHGRALEVSAPGARVAVQLADVHVAQATLTGGAGRLVGRGDVISRPGIGMQSRVLDVSAERSLRCGVDAADDTSAGAPALRDGLSVRVHVGTATFAAQVRLHGLPTLRAGERCLARLTLDRPVLACVGDRLLIRTANGRATLAGAIVLDPSPDARVRRASDRRSAAAAAQRAMLAERSARPHDVESLIASQARRDRVASIDSLRHALPDADASIEDAISALAARGEIVRVGDQVADRAAWDRCLQVVAQAVEQLHRARPELSGLPVAEARSLAAASLGVEPTSVAIDSAIDALGRGGYVRIGPSLRRHDHRPALPERLRAAGDRCRRQLNERPFDPPSRRELARDDGAAQALRFLIASGEVIELNAEIVIDAAAYAAAGRRIVEHLTTHPPATVTELKSLLGSSRRVMVPLLERLDRDGVTLRDGDRRTAGPGAVRLHTPAAASAMPRRRESD